MAASRWKSGPPAGWLAAAALCAACGNAGAPPAAGRPLVEAERLTAALERAATWRHADAEGEAWVERRDGAWERADWAGFPVDPRRVQEVAEVLGALTVLRSLALDDVALAAVGLEGPFDDACAIALEAPGGPALHVRLGHPVFDADVPARFARVDGGAAVVAALPRELDVAELAPHPLAGRVLLAIDRDRIASFRLTAADGAVLSGRRATPDATDFEPIGAPDPASGASTTFASIAGRAATLVTFDRVAADDEVVRAGDAASYAFETFDGLAVRLDTFAVSESPARRDARVRPRGDLWLSLECRTLPGASDEVRAEAEELTQRARGRVFQVPGRELALLRTARPSRAARAAVPR